MKKIGLLGWVTVAMAVMALVWFLTEDDPAWLAVALLWIVHLRLDRPSR